MINLDRVLTGTPTSVSFVLPGTFASVAANTARGSGVASRLSRWSEARESWMVPLATTRTWASAAPTKISDSQTKLPWYGLIRDARGPGPTVGRMCRELVIRVMISLVYLGQASVVVPTTA